MELDGPLPSLLLTGRLSRLAWGCLGSTTLALARWHILAHLALVPGLTTVFHLLRLQRRGHHTLGPWPGAQLSPVMTFPSHVPCGQHGLIVTAHPHPCTWLTSTPGCTGQRQYIGHCHQVPGLLPAVTCHRSHLSPRTPCQCLWSLPSLGFFFVFLSQLIPSIYRSIIFK